tara:strand:- start:150 stop:1151 length:1002 start_codon:yes stop_codon:yes gene_type:complete
MMGSVGVVSRYYDNNGNLWDAYDIKEVSTKNKTGSAKEGYKVTEEYSKEYLDREQKLTNEVYENFLNHVEDNGLDSSFFREVGGLCYNSKDSKKHGLCHSIETSTKFFNKHINITKKDKKDKEKEPYASLSVEVTPEADASCNEGTSVPAKQEAKAITTEVKMSEEKIQQLTATMEAQQAEMAAMRQQMAASSFRESLKDRGLSKEVASEAASLAANMSEEDRTKLETLLVSMNTASGGDEDDEKHYCKTNETPASDVDTTSAELERLKQEKQEAEAKANEANQKFMSLQQTLVDVPQASHSESANLPKSDDFDSFFKEASAFVQEQKQQKRA